MVTEPQEARESVGRSTSPMPGRLAQLLGAAEVVTGPQGDACPGRSAPGGLGARPAADRPQLRPRRTVRSGDGAGAAPRGRKQHIRPELVLPGGDGGAEGPGGAPELADGVVAVVDGLAALLAHDAHPDVRALYHGHVVGAVSDGQHLALRPGGASTVAAAARRS